ncbi:MAG: hydantoinase/oxoprolinase family protein [Simkania sp.]|nr:hydantoinase/oxoprolinase family protein [Simkania sp.]
MIIGIDVGGTFTDAVLVDDTGAIVSFRKKPTSADIETSVKALIDELMHPMVTSIHIGTTHALNALLQRKGLASVGLIRLAGHRPDFVPQLCNIDVRIETIGGGFECDGRPITPFSEREAKEAIERLIAGGAQRLAVVGTFSSLYPEQELAIAALSPLPVTLSHQLGGFGIIERENAAVINAALQPLFERGFSSLKYKNTPLFLSQNNGGLLPLERALEMPVLTLSAGPVNSFMGASRIAKCEDAIIVDIGGTSSDIGYIEKGYVKRSFRLSEVAGIPLNLPMPDLFSLAVGGGSFIDQGGIGPESAGSALFREAAAFGGERLTLTDAAIALGYVTIPMANPKRVSLSHNEAKRFIQRAAEKILSKIRGHKPLFFVGGGALLFPEFLWNNRGEVLPEASVANAYGAALAEKGITIDKIIPLSEQDALEEEVLHKAIQEGADPRKVRVVQCDVSPLAYDSMKRARIIITAMG